jgi:hypothetical protein
MLVNPNISYGLFNGNMANGIMIYHIETRVAPAEAQDNISK